MSDPIAVVTGAGSGIGRSLVSRLVAAEYQVVAIGRSERKLAETKRLAGKYADRVLTRAVDVRDAKALFEVVADAGKVQALVANAGICKQANIDSPDSDVIWQEVLSTNVDGVWNSFRAVHPHLEEGGRAVVVSSGLGKLGRAGYSAYTASKHAVLGLVKCLAKELAHRQITVNAVCPGWVDTEMAAADIVHTAKQSGLTPEEVRREAIDNIPLGRFVAPEEVASLICWLLSPDGGGVTGQAYNISCGEFFA